MQHHFRDEPETPVEIILAPRFDSRRDSIAVREVDQRERVMQEWLLGFRSTNTRAAYRNDVAAYFAWLDEFRDDLGVDVWSAGRVHLNSYAQYLSGEQVGMRYVGKQKYEPATIARKLTSLSSFYAYAVDEHPNLLAAGNPMRKVTRPDIGDDTVTKSIDLAEARAYMEASRTAGLLEHALVGLLLTTGMRISEAVKADTGDLDDERGRRIIWVTRKGGKRAKLVVPPEVTSALRRYTRGRRGPLFVGRESRKRIHRQQVDRVLDRVAELAFGKDHPKITPHVLRHTAATIALDAGRDIVDVQEMLGHADIKTTRRYIHGRDRLDNSAVHTVAELLGADKARDAGVSQ